MNVNSGRIGITRAELDDMRLRGYVVDEHTIWYVFGITVPCGDAFFGLYGWLDGLDAYIGDTKIVIESKEHADAFLAAMDSLYTLNNLRSMSELVNAR